jgi:hypothetical protein
LFRVLLQVRGLLLYSVRQNTNQPSPYCPPFYDTQLCQLLNQECKFWAIFSLLGARNWNGEITSCRVLTRPANDYE